MAEEEDLGLYQPTVIFIGGLMGSQRDRHAHEILPSTAGCNNQNQMAAAG